MLIKLALSNITINHDNHDIILDSNLSLQTGSLNLCIGQNGCGKSSLLKCIMGDPIHTIVQGTITLDNVVINHLTAQERAQKGIFLAFQDCISIANLSLRSMCLLFTGGNLSNQQCQKKLHDILGYFGLSEDYADKQFNCDNSGGEKKINEIIQMLLLEPNLCLLDEVDSGLDQNKFDVLVEHIKLLQQNNTTFLVVTHQPQVWQQKILVDQMIKIKDKRLNIL